MKFQRTLVIVILLFQAFFFLAQNSETCGTTYSEDPNFDQIAYKKYYSNFLQKQSDSEKSPIECDRDFTIRFHIFRNDDGLLGLDPAEVQPAFDLVQQHFAGWETNFVLADIHFVDNTTYYNYTGANSDELYNLFGSDHVIDIFCLENLGNSCGFARFPWSDNQFIFMNNSCVSNTSTLSHEIGHYFGLYHTHQDNNSILNSELVDGSNCLTAGDDLCDTPADPQLSNLVNSNCEYIGTAIDANGDAYQPDVTNLMSYSQKYCRTNFSQGQLAKMSWYRDSYYYFENYSPVVDGHEYIGKFQGHEYYLSNNALTVAEAEAEAASLGGHLAVINSYLENEFFQHRIDEMTLIGLNDANSEGNLGWTNGESFDYANFLICSFCNDNSEDNDYVLLHQWDSGWSFTNANTAHPYLVEIPCPAEIGFPNLKVDNISPNFSGAIAGQTVNADFTIANIGNTTVDSPFSIKAYLSDLYSPLDTTQHIFLKEFEMNGLGLDILLNENISFTIPNDIDPGSYQLYLHVDYKYEIAELMEYDNYRYVEIEILPSNGNNCQQSFQGFSFVGELYDHTYYLSNSTATGEEAKLIAESLGGYLVSINSQEENDLIENSIQIISYIGINDATTEGTLEWANDDLVNYTNWDFCSFCNQNTEINDYVAMHPWNGGWSFASSIRPFVVEIPCDSTSNNLPDLTLSNLNGIPSNAQYGDLINFTFDLNNIGTETAYEDYRIGIYLSTDNVFSSDDIEVGEVSNGVTVVGTIADVPSTIEIPNILSGNYFLILFADVDEMIIEENENNNTLTSPIVIDPVITGGGCPPSLNGFTALGEFNESKYFISDEAVQPADAQLIAQQNGGYLATISSQTENDFLQQNISEMVYIGLNDVQAEGSLIWGNGEPLNYNNISPCSFCNENSDDLDYVIMAPWDGTWSFSSQWNSRKYIVEIPCGITPNGTPDLTLLNPSGVPTTSQVGETVDLFFDLNNIGTGNVSGDFVIAAYLSTDELFNAGDIYLADLTTGDTPIGTESDLQLSFNVPTVNDGNYFIIVIADVNGEIIELDGSNNGIEIPIEILGMTATACEAIFTTDVGAMSNVFCIEENSNGNIEIINLENDTFFQTTIGIDGAIISTVELSTNFTSFEINNNTIVKSDESGNTLSTIPLDANVVNEFSSGENGFAGVTQNENGSHWLFAYERINQSSGIDQEVLFAILLNATGTETSRSIIDTVGVFDLNPNYHQVLSTGQNGGVLFRTIRYPNNTRLEEIIVSQDQTLASISTIASATSSGSVVYASNITPQISASPCGDHEYVIDISQYQPIVGPGLFTDQTLKIKKSYQEDFGNTLFSNKAFQGVAQVVIDRNYELLSFHPDGSYVAIEREIDIVFQDTVNDDYVLKKYDVTGGLLEEIELDWDFLPTYFFESSNGVIYSLYEENGTSYLTSNDCFSNDTTISNCPSTITGFTALGEFNGSKYFISDGTSQPAEAQLVAQQNGGYLAVINDQAENDFIQQNISDMVYIGLNDVQVEDELIWENGDPLNYNNINPCSFCNENSDDLDYVIMAPWDGAWSFSSQWNSRKYIVEVPCTYQGTETYFLTCPADIVKNNGDPSGPNHVSWASPIVFSDCPSGYILEGSHQPSWPFPTGINLVTYTLTPGAGCDGVVETCSFSVTINTNINSNSENSLINPTSSNFITEELQLQKVFPNPTSDNIFIKVFSPIQQDIDVQIFDARGVLWKELRIDLFEGDNKNEIDVSELPDGMYSIFIPQMESRNAATRFVKVK